MQITSDGKEPDLKYMAQEFKDAVKKAGSRARKFSPSIAKSISQKDIILENLSEAIKKASGNGQYRFSLRQLYYAVRPYVINELSTQPVYNYYCTVITDHETSNGDIELMYRDNRGTLYHPHLGQDIPIGTIAVENYIRPEWIFNKVLYIEKEGFFNVLKDNKLPEKFDMALLTSKGYASRAIKDLLDTIGADTEEAITFFCIHDADAAGTMIYETLQNETKARPGRKVNIINLGLEPDEAIAMGLEIERVDKSSRDKAVANYVQPQWKKWLQYNRVELNAMSTPQFLEWLEQKISLYDNGKVIPPDSVIEEKLELKIRNRLKEKIKDQILIENHFEDKVKSEEENMRHNYEDKIPDIRESIINNLKQDETSLWSGTLDVIADDILKFGILNGKLAS